MQHIKQRAMFIGAQFVKKGGRQSPRADASEMMPPSATLNTTVGAPRLQVVNRTCNPPVRMLTRMFEAAATEQAHQELTAAFGDNVSDSGPRFLCVEPAILALAIMLK